MVSCISLWWFVPQDECILNTLPYYITDLFIITYRYSKVIEGMTPPDVLSTWSRGCSFNAAPLPPNPVTLLVYRATLQQLFPNPFNLLQSIFFNLLFFHFQDTSYQLGGPNNHLIFSFVVFFLKVGAQSLAVSI